LVRMVAYLGLAFAFAWYILPRLIHWIHARPELSHSYGVPAAALVFALLFGWSAERFGGLAPITGAFIAGVGLSHMPEAIKRPIDEAVAHIAYAFLIPIFFVGIGLRVNLSQLQLNALPLAIMLLIAAVAGKVIGVGLGSYRFGFKARQAVRLGVCMIARGEVNLIIVSLGLAGGIFQANDPLFLSLFLVILLTTVLTPILVRIVFRKPTSPLAEGA
jgi:Kef-type K+ transport system membrane component KefB